MFPRFHREEPRICCAKQFYGIHLRHSRRDVQFMPLSVFPPSSYVRLTRRIDWSNFEIADMDFWRGPAYTAFFDYLDSTGGFYYEV